MDSEIRFLLNHRRNSDADCIRQEIPTSECCAVAVRHKITVLLLFCTFCANLFRINLNVALTFMVNDTVDSKSRQNSNHSTIYSDAQCVHKHGSYEGAHLFNWSIIVQYSLLAASYLGEGLCTLPAAYFVRNRGCKSVLTFSIGVASMIGVFLPSAAFYGYYYLACLRCLSGVALSFVFPGLLQCVKSWIPQQERTRLTLILVLGFCASHFIGSPLIAFLCTVKNSYGGWPIVFYLASIFGFIWMVCWTLTVTNKPDNHLNINRIEKYYIADSLKKDAEDIELMKSNFQWTLDIRSLTMFFFVLIQIAFFSAFRLLEMVMLIHLKRDLHIAVENLYLGFFDAIQYIMFGVCFFIFLSFACAISKNHLQYMRLFNDIANAFSLLSLAVGLTALPFVSCSQPMWVLALLSLIYSVAACYGGNFVSKTLFYVHVEKYFMLLVVTKAVADLSGSLVTGFAGIIIQYTDYSMRSYFMAVALFIYIVAFTSLIYSFVRKNVTTTHDDVSSIEMVFKNDSHEVDVQQ